MSKTYTDQVAKVRMLVDGLKKNLQDAHALSISDAEIETLQTQSDELDVINAELEKLREEVSGKAHIANSRLTALRELTSSVKSKVKKNVDPLKWAAFGIPDKR